MEGEPEPIGIEPQEISETVSTRRAALNGFLTAALVGLLTIGIFLAAASSPTALIYVVVFGTPIAVLFVCVGLVLHGWLARQGAHYHWTIAPLICAAIFGGICFAWGLSQLIWGSGSGSFYAAGEWQIVDGRLTAAGKRISLLVVPSLAAAFGALCGAFAWIGAFGFVARKELRE